MGDRVSKSLMVTGASAHPTTREKTVSSPSVSLKFWELGTNQQMLVAYHFPKNSRICGQSVKQ